MRSMLRVSIIFLPLFFISSISKLSFAGTEIMSHLEAAEFSDLVLDATIEKVVHKKANGGRPEDYSVLHISGNIIASDGVYPLRGRYLLRVSKHYDKGSVGTRSILFVRNNGETPDPISLKHTVSVRRSLLYKPLSNAPLTVWREGSLSHPIPFNSCTTDDYQGQDATVTNDDGTTTVWTREMQLEQLSSFECLDGSQWWAGNDRPNDYVDPEPISVEEFSRTLSEHLSSVGIPPPNVRPGMQNPPSGPLKKENRIDINRDLDRDYADLLIESGAVNEVRQDAIKALVERMRLRGQSIPPGIELKLQK